MSHLAWFTPPTSEVSISERRRTVRYPAGPSLRCRISPFGAGDGVFARVHTISTAGISVVVGTPLDLDTEAILNLRNAGRAYDCTLRVRLCHITECQRLWLVGGKFERALSKEEFERLTPTLSPWLEIEAIGDILVGRFKRADVGDEHAVSVIGEQLFGLVEELCHRHFILNFETVYRVNGSFLSQLLEFRRRVSRVGGQLFLCQLDPRVRHIFEATLLTRLFPIYPTEADAVRGFAFQIAGA